MIKFRSLAALALSMIFVVPTNALAVAFSNIFVLGDSLSDQGNLFNYTGGAVPSPAYTDGTNPGRFTNGQNYIDYLSSSYGTTTTPSLTGGTNFAWAGATIDSGIPTGVPSLNVQRDQLLAMYGGNIYDPNALFIVWGGGNDLVSILTGTSSNTIVETAANMAGVVDSLAAAGAHTILVPNLPNLGLTPLLSGNTATSAAATAMSEAYNNALSMQLDGLEALYADIEIIRFDTFALMNDIINNPNAYGFNDVISPCFNQNPVTGATTVCANPDEHFFWDYFHPTSATHEILADRIALAISTQVPEPNVIVLMLTGLLALRLRKKMAAVR